MQENERKEQQAQDISWEIEEEEPAEDTQEQGLLNITFIPKYMDIFDGLCATDQADGTGKRARMLFAVLVLLMFVGGCAGSTGGGLKVTRVVTLVKAAFMDMRKMIHPNAVVNVRMEGRAMPEKQVRGVQAYFSVYMLLYAVSWLLLSLNGFDLLSTFTALSACINNIGPGLGMVGPTGNFSAFAPWAKLLLSFDMLAGRLEIFPMLVLFLPDTWRRF